MKKFLLTAFLIFFINGFAQIPRFSKYSVAETPVQIYLPTAPTWDKSTTKDGSAVFIYSDTFGKINYAAIIIKVAVPVQPENSESLLENYMAFTEDSIFSLAEKAGYGRGHTLENQPTVKGILQMGKSKDGTEYKIMGWTDGKYIGILATSSLEEMNINIQEMFLRGIRFPQ